MPYLVFSWFCLDISNYVLIVTCLQELRERNRQLYRSIAVFPCRLRILPNCIFNTRDPIVVGVVVESGIVKPGTPLTVPSKGVSSVRILLCLGTGLDLIVVFCLVHRYRSCEQFGGEPQASGECSEGN